MSPTRGVGSCKLCCCLQPGTGPELPLAGVYRKLGRGQLAARGMFLYHLSHTQCSAAGKRVMIVAVSEGRPRDQPSPVSSLNSSPKSKQPAKAPPQPVRKARGGRAADG